MPAAPQLEPDLDSRAIGGSSAGRPGRAQCECIVGQGDLSVSWQRPAVGRRGRVPAMSRLLTVTVLDDDIATLAADDVGALIGRGDAASAVPFEVWSRWSVRAMEISDVATLCDECDQLALGWEAQIRGNESGVVVP